MRYFYLQSHDDHIDLFIRLTTLNGFSTSFNMIVARYILLGVFPFPKICRVLTPTIEREHVGVIDCPLPSDQHWSTFTQKGLSFDYELERENGKQ